MRLTFHMLPADVWETVKTEVSYSPPSLAAEGFIHCTDGAAEMVQTANRHYREEPGAFVILTVDLDRNTAPWKFDGPARIYPHIYGALDLVAVVDVRPFPRSEDGAFVLPNPQSPIPNP